MTLRLSPNVMRSRHASRRTFGESVAYEMVLTNPPFGKRSSITVINEEGEEAKESLTYVRDDFWATTGQAVSERGFFGNQNTVARPTSAKWIYTIQVLKQKFEIT
jgi:tRNA1(Val) A37 N6-methylase TrmN6